MNLEKMKLSHLFSHWKQLNKDLLWTIDQFSDDDLFYRPFDGSWTVGDIMLHIPDAEDGWFRYAVTRELSDWPSFTIDEYPNIEAIKGLISDVHARTEAFLDKQEIADLERMVKLPWKEAERSLGWIIWHVIEHEIHHRGELSLILGTLGKKGLDV